MTGSINPINVNTQGVGNKMGYGAQPKADSEAGAKAETQAKSAEQTSVEADKIFDYMAANSAVVVTPKSVDPAKYVDAASEARIASFMGAFEDKVAEGLKAFEQEFAGMNISESTKMAVVLGQVEQEA